MFEASLASIEDVQIFKERVALAYGINSKESQLHLFDKKGINLTDQEIIFLCHDEANHSEKRDSISVQD